MGSDGYEQQIDTLPQPFLDHAQGDGEGENLEMDDARTVADCQLSHNDTASYKY